MTLIPQLVWMVSVHLDTDSDWKSARYLGNLHARPSKANAIVSLSVANLQWPLPCSTISTRRCCCCWTPPPAHILSQLTEGLSFLWASTICGFSLILRPRPQKPLCLLSKVEHRAAVLKDGILTKFRESLETAAVGNSDLWSWSKARPRLSPVSTGGCPE